MSFNRIQEFLQVFDLLVSYRDEQKIKLEHACHAKPVNEKKVFFKVLCLLKCTIDGLPKRERERKRVFLYAHLLYIGLLLFHAFCFPCSDAKCKKAM